MTIVHFIPKGEEEMHDRDADCLCGPEIVEPRRLENCTWCGEVCYEHRPFSPLAPEVKGGCVEYLVAELHIEN